MRIAIVIFGLMGSVSCTPDPSTEALDALRNGDLKILGHAGNGTRSLHPPNGISGIFCTLANGADGLEVDVRLTADDTLVLYHDQQLETASHCQGTVEGSHWSDIKYCEHRALLADDTLLALADLIRYPLMKGRFLSLDIKFNGAPNDKARRRMVDALFRDLSLRTGGEVCIESQDRKFLTMCAQKGIVARRLLYTALSDEDEAGLAHDSIDGVSIDMNLVRPGDVARWKKAGVFVMLWGATTRRNNILAIDMLPDAVQSDRPNHLSSLRNN